MKYIAPSLPMRGVWIEMVNKMEPMTYIIPSLPMRGVWIEIVR